MKTTTRTSEYEWPLSEAALVADLTPHKQYPQLSAAEQAVRHARERRAAHLEELELLRGSIDHGALDIARGGTVNGHDEKVRQLATRETLTANFERVVREADAALKEETQRAIDAVVTEAVSRQEVLNRAGAVLRRELAQLEALERTLAQSVQHIQRWPGSGSLSLGSFRDQPLEVVQ